MTILPPFLVLLIATVLLWYAARRSRRRRLRSTPFPSDWREILKTDFPLYSKLPDSLRVELEKKILVFLDEKYFTGCGGLVLNDEIRVLIAAQACLLSVNMPGEYYKGLSSILVYPSTYVAREKKQEGWVTTEGRSVRLGESWKQGRVVLAWDAVLRGAVNPADGHNVVMHEFAHQLDAADGVSNGTPLLNSSLRYAAWAQVLTDEFNQLALSIKKHQTDVLDPYGSTNPAEFFAVATEAFFEKPNQLLKQRPKLYQELRDFFLLNPSEWVEK